MCRCKIAACALRTCLALRSNTTYCWHWSSLRFFIVQKWRTRFSLCSSSLRMSTHKTGRKKFNPKGKIKPTTNNKPVCYRTFLQPQCKVLTWCSKNHAGSGFPSTTCGVPNMFVSNLFTYTLLQLQTLGAGGFDHLSSYRSLSECLDSSVHITSTFHILSSSLSAYIYLNIFSFEYFLMFFFFFFNSV